MRRRWDACARAEMRELCSPRPGLAARDAHTARRQRARHVRGALRELARVRGARLRRARQLLRVRERGGARGAAARARLARARQLLRLPARARAPGRARACCHPKAHQGSRRLLVQHGRAPRLLARHARRRSSARSSRASPTATTSAHARTGRAHRQFTN
jgi:hypothetical protein